MPKPTNEPPFRFDIEFTLPPAGVNHIYENVYRFAQGGRRYTARKLTDEAAAWKARAGYEAKLRMRRLGLQAPLFRRTFAFNYWFWWKDKRTQIDADGATKLILDSMNKIVFSSDKFALPRCMALAYDEARPRVRVEIISPVPELFEVQQ